MSTPVQPSDAVAVIQAVLLRTKLPELPLREGASFVARVASRGEGGAASLVIAGELVAAKVPEDVPAGATLRLTVVEITPERILLRMDPLPVAGPPTPPPPEGPRIAVEERAGSRGAAGEGRAGVTLAYETEALGRLRLRIETGPGGVSAVIEVPGRLRAAAEQHAERLRSDLAAATGSSARVRIVARGEPSVDVYA